MDCMQSKRFEAILAEAQEFQYRKRYGLHAITLRGVVKASSTRFQYRKRYGLHAMMFGFFSGRLVRAFQYRKRYGLHAILSPRTLENSEPKRWFSSTPSLFALFPKPQGIFCHKKWFKRGAKPAISRKLLSTRKT